MAETPVIEFFSEDQVVRLTRLTRRQLREWDQRGWVKPSYAFENRRVPDSRIYSFKDVVGLRMIAELRRSHRVSLTRLIGALKELEERGYEHWADIRLYVVKRQIHFREPGSDEVLGLSDGQQAMLPIINWINDVNKGAVELLRRQPDQIGRTEQSRRILRNERVVSGTRIPVATVVRLARSGLSHQQIVSEYPLLTEEDVRAVIGEYGKKLFAA